MIIIKKYDEKIRRPSRRKPKELKNENRILSDILLFKEIIPVNLEKYLLYANMQDNTINGFKHLSVKYMMIKINEENMSAISLSEKQMHTFIFQPENLMPYWKHIEPQKRLDKLKNSEAYNDLVLGLKLQMIRKIPNKKELMNLEFINYINTKMNFNNQIHKYKLELSFCSFNYEYFNNLELQEKNSFNKKYILGKIIPPESIHSKGRNFTEIGMKEKEKIKKDLEGRKDVFIDLSKKFEYNPEWNIRLGTYQKLEKIIRRSEKTYEHSLKTELEKINL